MGMCLDYILPYRFLLVLLADALLLTNELKCRHIWLSAAMTIMMSGLRVPIPTEACGMSISTSNDREYNY